MKRIFASIIQREEDLYVALCPELDIASQGPTIQEAKANLQEAVELFLEEADSREIEERIHYEQYVSTIEVSIG